MPNWVEGNLKIRGRIEDIKNFIEHEMVWGQDPNLVQAEVTINELYGEMTVYRPNDRINNYLWINGSRNYVQPHGDSFGVYWNPKNKHPDTVIMVFEGYNAAWDVDVEPYIRFSNEYNIDFRIIGFEQGLEFGVDISIEDGHLVKAEHLKYENWDWDCPFPYFGG
jgi:hypothetical protein